MRRDRRWLANGGICRDSARQKMESCPSDADRVAPPELDRRTSTRAWSSACSTWNTAKRSDVPFREKRQPTLRCLEQRDGRLVAEAGNQRLRIARRIRAPEQHQGPERTNESLERQQGLGLDAHRSNSKQVE